MRVLASAAGETDAYPALLAAIGESLGCAGALWLPSEEDGELRCAETWPAGAAAGASLVARRVDHRAGRRARRVRLPARPHVGVMAFATTAPLESDDDLLATMESLGTQISQFVERCRAQQAVRASEARKTAILNAAFDCIITMDHEGDVVEVNRATERTFGYRADEMIGRELAALIVPPSSAGARTGAASRATCRPGRRRSAATRSSATGDAHGRQRVPGRGDRHPRRPPGPAAVLRLPARRHRDQGARARPAAAGARSRRRCGGWRPRSRPRPIRGACSASSPRRSRGCSVRRARTWCASTRRLTATVVGGWSEAAGAQRPGRRHRAGSTATPRPAASSGPRAPARIDDYDAIPGELALHLRGLGFRCARRRADLPRRAPVGRGDRLQRRPGAVRGPAPSSGSRTSPSWPRRRWRTRTRARSWPRRAPASSRRATSSGGGWSATCTTGHSSGWSRSP